MANTVTLFLAKYFGKLHLGEVKKIISLGIVSFQLNLVDARWKLRKVTLTQGEFDEPPMWLFTHLYSFFPSLSGSASFQDFVPKLVNYWLSKVVLKLPFQQQRFLTFFSRFFSQKKSSFQRRDDVTVMASEYWKEQTKTYLISPLPSDILLTAFCALKSQFCNFLCSSWGSAFCAKFVLENTWNERKSNIGALRLFDESNNLLQLFAVLTPCRPLLLHFDLCPTFFYGKYH